MEWILPAIAILIIVCIILILVWRGRQRWSGHPHFLKTSGLDVLEALTTNSKLYLTAGGGGKMVIQIYEFVRGSMANIKFISGSGGQLIDDGEYEIDATHDHIILFDESKVYLHLIKNGVNPQQP
jgi:hypothetical protein